jgi:hypothetical protein
MNETTAFAAGAGATLAAALIVVAYLRRPLRAILTDLCGTGERARFWMAFSNVTLILTPLVFAMHMRPDREEKLLLVDQLGAQMEAALIGLVAAVLVLGFVIGQFIPRGAATPAKPAGAGTASPAPARTHLGAV